MRVLVTGGAGYIGSHTVKALIDKGHDPVVIDNLVCGHKSVVTDILKVPLIISCIGNKENLFKVLLGKHEELNGTIHEGRTIEAVIHFAAYAYVGESIKNPLKYYENNVQESIILLESICSEICIEKRDDNYVTLYEMARESTGLNLIDTVKMYKDIGIGELLITDIKRDGCYTGLNKEIYDIILNFKDEFPIILSGGFINLEDINHYKDILSGISISSAFHLKKLKVSETIKYRNKIIY